MGKAPTFRRQNPIGPYISPTSTAPLPELVVEVDELRITLKDEQIAHDAARGPSIWNHRLSRSALCPGRDVMASADEAAQGIVQAAIYWIK